MTTGPMVLGFDGSTGARGGQRGALLGSVSQLIRRSHSRAAVVAAVGRREAAGTC
jgi:hypothetical protein